MGAHKHTNLSFYITIMITNRMTFGAICLIIGCALAREMHVLRRSILGDEGTAVSQSETMSTHTKATETMSAPAKRTESQRRDSRKGIRSHPNHARVCKESDNVHQTMEGRRIDSRRAMS